MNSKTFILDLIPQGRQNAIFARDIGTLMNMDVRMVRKMIEKLRREGNLICASSNCYDGGYFLPCGDKSDIQDVLKYYRKFSNRINEQKKSRQPFEDFLIAHGALPLNDEAVE